MSYIKNLELPSTDYNIDGSTLYAKICNIKTHIQNLNSSISQSKFDTRQLLLFNVISFTANSYDQCFLVVRIKSGDANGNKLFTSNKTTNFKIVYIREDDGSYTIYVQANKNEKVKFQLIEGFDGFVNYEYNSKFDNDLDVNLINEIPYTPPPFLGEDPNTIKINSAKTGFIIDTPASGIGFQPSRDGSIPLGASNKRFKGGYFTDILMLPVKNRLNVPAEPKDGYLFINSSENLIQYYVGGNWFYSGKSLIDEENGLSLDFNTEKTGFILDTPSGGIGLQPSRDGSIPLGAVNRRFKGGYFTDVVMLPVKNRLNFPENPQNGFMFINSSTNMIQYYINGEWLATGKSLIDIDKGLSIDFNEDKNGYIFNTPVGGRGLEPSRDGSIPLGSPNKRFKGGYFTQHVAIPSHNDKSKIENPINGSTFFHTTLKKLVTYYEGNWYSNGEKVNI